MVVEKERFYNEINKLYRKINELHTTMERTNEKIRDYNGLREDVEWTVREVKALKARREQTTETTHSARSWLLLVATASSSLIALVSTLYIIFGGG